MAKAVLRWLGWVVLASLALQLFFVLYTAALARWNPISTSMQRSQIWALAQADGAAAALHWRQHWRSYGAISSHLKRAVVAAEDDRFTQHNGLDWPALRQAWMRNQASEHLSRPSKQRPNPSPETTDTTHATQSTSPALRGGSTITQQLAKNLLLSGERTWLRKGQELALTLLLEQFLSKQRILELYLNHAEWGRGVFGAEAAAQHYYGKSAAELGAYEAARLAVMLPAPRRFEQTPRSAYLAARARTIQIRMAASKIP